MNKIQLLLANIIVWGMVSSNSFGQLSTNTILPGQIVSGKISSGAQTNFYTFAASNNDVFTVGLLSTSGTGAPHLAIYDPAGNLTMESAGNGTLIFDESRRLVQTGTFTLAVKSSGSSFDFLLNLTDVSCGMNSREPGDGPETLSPGTFSGGRLTPLDMDTFCFEGVSNEVVNLALMVTNGSGINPYVQVYDPAGTFLFTTPLVSGTLAFRENWRLAASGTYTVMVRDDVLNESFDYCLNLIKAPGPNFTDPGDGPERLVSGEIRTASLTPGDLDAFAVKVVPGDRLGITLNILSASGGSPLIKLLGPDGVIINSATGARSAMIKSECLWSPETYYIFIWDDGLNEAYDYQLTVVQSPSDSDSSGLAQYLAIFQCTNYAFVRWETNAVGFDLEWCSDLAEGAGAWTPAGPPSFRITDHYYFGDSLTNRHRFFRLKHTGP
jgi:hypothetical protein